MAKNVKSTVKLNMPMVRKLTAGVISTDSRSNTYECSSKSGNA